MNTMNILMKNCRSSRDCGLLALRIAVGVIFILHGYGKLFGGAPGMEAFTGMVAGIGFPAPALFAYVAALSEFLGGIAILLGVFTCVASTLIGIVMLVALVMVKKFNLPMADADLALLGSAIALMCMGPGRYSIAAQFCKGKTGRLDADCCSGGACCQEGGKKA